MIITGLLATLFLFAILEALRRYVFPPTAPHVLKAVVALIVIVVYAAIVLPILGVHIP